MLELKGTDTQAFDDAVEELAKVVNHHLTEEELTILNPAREEVGERVRAELGEQFATERNRQIDDGCGSLTNVRRIVAAARKEGLLDDDDEDEARPLAPGRRRGQLLALLPSQLPLLLADDAALVGLDDVLRLHHRAQQRDRGPDRREHRPREAAEHRRPPR